jgi:hypothetical protein
MSIRSKQAAAFYLAAYSQSLIDQLELTEQNYSSHTSKLDPAQKSLKEQIEIILYPYLNTHENQKRFALLCEYFAFEKYLEKNILDYLACIRAEEIEEFVAEQEKLSKEKYNMQMELDKIHEMNRRDIVTHMQEFLVRIDKVISILKEQIEKLRIEIQELQEKRDVLVERAQENTRELDKVMVKLYRDCAQNNENIVLDIGGFQLAISDSIIINRIADHMCVFRL